MRTRRRYTAGIVLVIALIGVTGLSEALERLMPVIPLVDMVQLVGVGVCFGIAISVLYARLRNPRDHSDGEP